MSRSPPRLYLMDGIEGRLAQPRHSVDMLLTDPPYGTTRNYWDVPLPLEALWEAVRWAVKPNGAVLLFAQCPFDKVLGASNLAMLRYEWVWYKERGTGFLNANRAPLKKSENILVFYQKPPQYNPQFTYGEPYRRVYSRSGHSPNYGKFERTGSECSDGRRYPGNVLFVPAVTGGIHPTQKPVELCEYFIKTYTSKGEVVADICAGSGTTAVAALNTGRRYLCFENAPAFYGPAAQRIDEARRAVAGGGKMIEIGKGGKRNLKNYMLSRYACYLIMQNGDPRKEVIAIGQTYFAIQTRRQEIADAFNQLDEDNKRLVIRGEVKSWNSMLADAAHRAGITEQIECAEFQNAGYMGLYGGLRVSDIHARKGLAPEQKILDHMSSEELGANLFCITQTEAKMRRDDPCGLDEASAIHYTVGKEVRETIKKIGGTMPEDLPTPQKSISQVEREQLKQLKKDRKKLMLDE